MIYIKRYISIFLIFIFLFMFLYQSVFANSALITWGTRLAPYASPIANRMSLDIMSLLTTGAKVYNTSDLTDLVTTSTISDISNTLAQSFSTNTPFEYSFNRKDLIYAMRKNWIDYSNNDSLITGRAYYPVGTYYQNRFFNDSEVRVFTAQTGYLFMYFGSSYDGSFGLNPVLKPFVGFGSKLIMEEQGNSAAYLHFGTQVNYSPIPYTWSTHALSDCDKSFRTCPYNQQLTTDSSFLDDVSLQGVTPNTFTLDWFNSAIPVSIGNADQTYSNSALIKIIPISTYQQIRKTLELNEIGFIYDNYVQPTATDGTALKLTATGALTYPNGSVYNDEPLIKIPSVTQKATIDLTIGKATAPVATTGGATDVTSPAFYDIAGWLELIFNWLQSLVQSIIDGIKSLFIPQTDFKTFVSRMPSITIPFLNNNNILSSANSLCFDLPQFQYKTVSISSSSLTFVCDSIQTNIRPYINTALAISFIFYVLNSIYKLIRGVGLFDFSQSRSSEVKRK